MDLEEARKKKLEEMKKQAEEQEKSMQAEEKIDSILKQIIESDAKSRLARIRMVNPETYSKAVAALVQFARANGIQQKISDEQVKGLLEKLAEKKEITIKRK